MFLRPDDGASDIRSSEDALLGGFGATSEPDNDGDMLPAVPPVTTSDEAVPTDANM